MRTLQSCDTMVAMGCATANGQTIFAKNSDRAANECQPLVQQPRRSHAPGAITRCQFIELPEAAVTYRHVGSRPHWCWGYEHGFNEHQVAIGNEAVFSRFPEFTEPKLVGMEIIRLGLERGRTAAEGMEIMTDLITRYGQGKFANDANVLTYDNSYIVADPREAYVIETAGHEWAVKQVERTTGISNIHSIGTDWSLVSPRAESRATELGWWRPGAGRFDFAGAYAVPRDRAAARILPLALHAPEDWSVGDFQQHLQEHEGLAISEEVIAAVITHRHNAPWRCARSCDLLRQHDGSITASTMMSILSDHADGHSAGAPFETTISPGCPSICTHRALDGRGGNTAACLVADLCGDGSRLPVYWCGFYSPCLGLFLPVFIEGELPETLSRGGPASSDDARRSDGSPWWQFRNLSRAVYADLGTRVPLVRDTWTPMQEGLVDTAYDVAREGRRLIDGGQQDRATRLLTEYMAESVATMLAAVAELLDEFRVQPVAEAG